MYIGHTMMDSLATPRTICPAQVAQWLACQTHDLVVVSLRPG